MARPRVDDGLKKLPLIEAAGALFLEGGAGAISSVLVAKRAGVSTRTVYELFPDRSALVVATVDRFVILLGAHIEDTEELVGSPHKALRSFGLRLLRILSMPESMAVFRFAVSEGAQFPAIIATIERRAFGVTLKVLTRYLKEEVDRGTLAIADPRLAATQFLGMIKEPLIWPQLFGQRPVGLSRRQVVEAAVAAFLTLYAAPEPAKKNPAFDAR